MITVTVATVSVVTVIGFWRVQVRSPLQNQLGAVRMFVTCTPGMPWIRSCTVTPSAMAGPLLLTSTVNE